MKKILCLLLPLFLSPNIYSKYQSEYNLSEDVNTTLRDIPDQGLLKVNFKTQVPIQHGFAVEFITPIRMSAYVNVGIYSAAYTKMLINMVPDRNPNKSSVDNLINDRLKNGFVFEFGSHYYFRNPKNYYVGLNLQFQKFSVSATPYELIEVYDFGGDAVSEEQINETITNSTADFFYRNTIIEPIFKPIQLGFVAGRSFYFKRAPHLSISTELSYLLNIKTNFEVTSPSFIGRIVVSNLVNPELNFGSQENFNDYNLPTLTVKFNYYFNK